jgi:hypothetical protein
LHLLGLPPALLLMWSATYPGTPMLPFLAGALATLVVAGCWAARLFIHVMVHGERRRMFLIAPALVLTLLGFNAVGGPLQARWQFSQHDFNRVVASLQAQGLVDSAGSTERCDTLDVPSRIGTYSIIAANCVPGGIVFYESHGELFDDAGFGWFPHGPDVAALESGSFESAQFTHLRGPWYTWTASW